MWKKDLLIAILGTLFSSLLGFVWQTYIGRTLGPHGFGYISSTSVIVVTIASIASLGSGGFWLNRFGEHGVRALRWAKPTLQMVAISTVLALLVAVLYATFGASDRYQAFLILLLMPLIPAQAVIDLASTIAQLKRDQLAVAIYQSLTNFLRLCIYGSYVVFCKTQVNSVTVVALCMAAASAISFAGATQALNSASLMKLRTVEALRKLSLRPALRNTPSISEVAANSWPFAAVGLLYSIYYQIDIVMIAGIRGPREAGEYNAAFLLLSAFYLIPGAVFNKLLLPRVQKWSFHNPLRYRQIFLFASLAMFCAGLALTVMLHLIGGTSLEALFGRAYDGSGRVLTVLSLAAPFHCASFALGIVMMSQRYIKKLCCITATAAILNITMNLFLIPKYGGLGAANATMFTEIIVFISLLFCGRRVGTFSTN